MLKSKWVLIAPLCLVSSGAMAEINGSQLQFGPVATKQAGAPGQAVQRADLKGVPNAAWRPAQNGNTPAGVSIEQLPSGIEDQARRIPVCRVSYTYVPSLLLGGGPSRKGQHPGKLANGRCYFTYRGRELTEFNYEVLTMQADSFGWVRWNGVVPPEAVLGGVEDAVEGGKRSLFICRTAMGNPNIIHTGKIHEQKCFVGWNGREEAMADFEVLVHRGPTSPEPPGSSSAPAPRISAALLAQATTTPTEPKQPSVRQPQKNATRKTSPASPAATRPAPPKPVSSSKAAVKAPK